MTPSVFHDAETQDEHGEVCSWAPAEPALPGRRVRPVEGEVRQALREGSHPGLFVGTRGTGFAGPPGAPPRGGGAAGASGVFNSSHLPLARFAHALVQIKVRESIFPALCVDAGASDRQDTEPASHGRGQRGAWLSLGWPADGALMTVHSGFLRAASMIGPVPPSEEKIFVNCLGFPAVSEPRSQHGGDVAMRHRSPPLATARHRSPPLAHLSQLAGVKPAKCLIRLGTRSKVSTTSALVQAVMWARLAVIFGGG